VSQLVASGCRCGVAFSTKFISAKKNALTHDFTGFEFHGSAGRDDHVVFWLVWVAAHAGFREANFKHTKVAEFHIATSSKSLSDAVQGLLDDFEDFLLGDASGFADLHYQIPFS
jgi:hypothetical protein